MALNVENRKQPVCAASAFGRLFFGARSRVYFSQVYEDNVEALGRMYQRNDPTSADNSDLLPTDGGEIFIPEAGRIVELQPMYNGVLVFADNGLWHIRGGDSGFSAVMYAVTKINSFGIISAGGVVVYESIAMYPTKEGILVIHVNDQGNIQTQNMTEGTIDTHYKYFIEERDDLDEDMFIRGAVDPVNKYILWTNSHFLSSPSRTKGLQYDLQAQAWYPQEFIGVNGTSALEYVKGRGVMFLSGVFLREFDEGALQDYGSSYPYYIQTQPETLNAFSHRKSAPNIFVLMNKTEEQVLDYNYSTNTFVYDNPSACTMTVKFDFDGTNAGNKFTKPKEIYRPMPKNYMPPSIPHSFDTGDTVVQFRDIIRGQGKAVQFRFDGTPGKDMQILGYSVEYSTRGRQ